jgi:uncharacterized membrane protein YfcA
MPNCLPDPTAIATAIGLAACFLVAAILYSSVGHAGASGYLAVMAFAGVAPATMKPTALVLNLIVAAIAGARFMGAGFFSWPLLWPFAVGSIPAAFIGGAITLPGHWYKSLVGGVLCLAAVRLAIRRTVTAKSGIRPPRPSIAVLYGILLGLLAGLTGTGGGIFLSPLLLFMGWAETREIAGVSAAFIFVNSAAGLAGNLASVQHLPPALPLWAGAVVVGGLLGTHLGITRVGAVAFRRALALVLLIAGTKLILVT